MAAPTPHPTNVFISYSRSDSAMIDRLEAELIRHGFRTWVDREHLEGGDKWAAQIEGAIQASDAVIVALSPDAVESQWVINELFYAHRAKKPIIPILFRSVEHLPLLLASTQYIDMQGNESQGLQQLRQRLMRLGEQPGALMAPATPASSQAVSGGGGMAKFDGDEDDWDEEDLESEPEDDWDGEDLESDSEVEWDEEDEPPPSTAPRNDWSEQPAPQQGWNAPHPAPRGWGDKRYPPMEPRNDWGQQPASDWGEPPAPQWGQQPAPQQGWNAPHPAPRGWGDEPCAPQWGQQLLPQQGEPKLVVSVGKEPGRSYEIRKDRVTIGRNRESDVFLEDLKVSRTHTTINRQPDGRYLLRDENSANGTMVNNQRVDEYLLKDGDKIRIGQTLFVFVYS